MMMPGIHIPNASQVKRQIRKKSFNFNPFAFLPMRVIEIKVRELLNNWGYPPHEIISIESPIVEAMHTNNIPKVLLDTTDAE
tara:strand:- start:2139 stop:2384 length:246 start_codon:yes stop_codon:yes gene_type:complete